MEKLKLTLLGYADRVDALSLRERVMVFLAVAAVLFLGYNTLLLEPLLVRQKTVSDGLQQRQSEVNAIEQQIQALLQRRSDDPDAANRISQMQLKQQIGDLDKQLLERQSRLVPADRMVRLLESMLRENRRLQVVTFRSVPPVELGSKAGAPAAAASNPGRALPSDRGLYRHGIELALRGSYPDLLSYVSALEHYQDKFYLGASTLSANSVDATLTLNLYTISLSSAWVTF
jgi:MSHA biogenesis protein MshJ